MGKLANSIARDIASPAVKMGNRSLFSVAPCRWLSFAHFSFASKEKCERPIGLQALLPRRSRRVNPRPRGIAYGKLASIDASRVAFRSPPCTPFGPHSARKPQGKQSGKNMRGFLGANNRRVRPHREQGIAPAGAQNAFLKANHQRGPHCRALHRPFAATNKRGCPQKQNPRRRPFPAAGVFLPLAGRIA